MCENPVPCACTLEKRAKRRAEHIARSDALRRLDVLYDAANREWDDAIHIASPDDPLRSLCGHFGRNLTDLPDRPGGAEGCWTCLHKADRITAQEAREAVPA